MPSGTAALHLQSFSPTRLLYSVPRWMDSLKGRHIVALSSEKMLGCECGKKLVKLKGYTLGHIRHVLCTCVNMHFYFFQFLLIHQGHTLLKSTLMRHNKPYFVSFKAEN